jgi:hypothetical protein
MGWLGHAPDVWRMTFGQQRGGPSIIVENIDHASSRTSKKGY